MIAGDSNALAATPSGVRFWLRNWFTSTVELMKVMARACGHESFSGFSMHDLSTWDHDMARLSGVAYAGVGTAD